MEVIFNIDETGGSRDHVVLKSLWRVISVGDWLERIACNLAKDVYLAYSVP